MAISSYLGLITSEYAGQPNFTAWLSDTLQIVDDGMNALIGMPSDFELASAVGAQLDVIGAIVGVNRNVQIALSTGTSILDDTHFRTLIQAKIAQNQWDGTTPAIYALWSSIFPDSQIQIIDNQNMTMQAVVTGLSDPIYSDLLTAGLIIPKPSGVGLTIVGSSAIAQPEYFGGLVTENTTAQLTTNTP